MAVQVALAGNTARTTLLLAAEGPTRSAFVPRTKLAPPCITAMAWPNKLMEATRLGPLLAEKEKLSTPLVMPFMVSHVWSVLGLNGGRRFSAGGNTIGNASAPAATPSNFGVESTNA